MSNPEGTKGRTLPPFPVDDFTLDQLEHALNTSVDIDENGERHYVGGEFTIGKFLDFMSGYDAERATHVGYAGDTPIYECWDAHYSEHCVMRALIAEIRRLRSGEKS